MAKNKADGELDSPAAKVAKTDADDASAAEAAAPEAETREAEAAEKAASPAKKPAKKPAAKKKKAAPKEKKEKVPAVVTIESIPRAPTPRAAVPEGARSLKVISVNIASLRAILDPAKPPEKREALAALVAKEAPDVLCFNEHKLKASDVDKAKEGLAELLPAYSRAVFTCSGPPGKNGYSGVAMLVKDGGAVPADAGIAEGMPLLDEEGEMANIKHEGRVLTLQLPELAVVAAYVPNSGQQLQRKDTRVRAGGWDRSLGAYVKSLATPVAVVGDLNCCSRAEDIHNIYTAADFEERRKKSIEEQMEKGGLSRKPPFIAQLLKMSTTTLEERNSFQTLLAEASLVDSFREQHGDALGAFSYFSQRFPQNRVANKGLRLDYVLASAGLMDAAAPTRLVDSFVLSDADTPGIADHLPVGATFVLG